VKIDRRYWTEDKEPEKRKKYSTTQKRNFQGKGTRGGWQKMQPAKKTEGKELR